MCIPSASSLCNSSGNSGGLQKVLEGGSLTPSKLQIEHIVHIGSQLQPPCEYYCRKVQYNVSPSSPLLHFVATAILWTFQGNCCCQRSSLYYTGCFFYTIVQVFYKNPMTGRHLLFSHTNSTSVFAHELHIKAEIFCRS